MNEILARENFECIICLHIHVQYSVSSPHVYTMFTFRKEGKTI